MQGRKGLRSIAPIAFTALLATPLLVAWPAGPAQAAPNANVAVFIDRVQELDDPDPGPTQGDGDFFARVTIGPNPTETTGEVSGEDFDPNWGFNRNVDAGAGPVTITIRLTDADDFPADPDDEIDINPVDNRTALTLTYDPFTGSWEGDIPSGQTFAQGDGDTEHSGIFEGGEQGRIEFTITSSLQGADSDGDGLLDAWETGGFDADGNGTIDVDLPAMGANPNHKDIFLELDYVAANAPSRASIQAMKAAFAAAPIDAGTQASAYTGGVNAKPNPDGTRGITLHVDTGNLVDSNAREGQVPGTCTDGIDNGADGLIDGADNNCGYLETSVEDPFVGNCADGVDNASDADALADAADPECLVGDNLGGGAQVANPNPITCNLDPAFYQAKAANFNPLRRLVFRYSLSLPLDPSCPSSGGWGEIGGNDFMDFNHDGGTIFHELGHTLNLQHGGFEGANCKPNYMSSMNYDLQFGTLRNGGGSVIDFSPPRIALDGSTRATVPGPLVENNLDEPFVLMPSDNANQMVFVNSAGQKTQRTANQNANWNSDADPPFENDQTVNIDTSDATSGSPGACTNAVSNSTFTSADDWLRISLPFRQFGDSANGAIDPETDPNPTLQELLIMHQELNSADLSVTLTDAPDPVAAGTVLTYTVNVTNNGPNPSNSTQVALDVASGLTPSPLPAGCVGTTDVTCGLGVLQPGQSTSLAVPMLVAANLVYANGGPLSISATATVDNLVGADPNAGNSSASTTTQVVAVADVEVVNVSVLAPPTEIIIGEPVDVTVRTIVDNNGPSSPIDTVLTRDATAEAGTTVDPDAPTVTPVNALTINENRAVDRAYELSCTAPGEHTFTFDSSLALKNAADTDPNLSNNTGQTTLTVDCVVPIAINIKPGTFENPINRNPGQTPVAALTTVAGEYGLPLPFNAATILPLTARFGPPAVVAGGGGAVESHGRSHIERSIELDERTKDADLDNVLHFTSNQAGFALTDTEGCLKGKFVSGPDVFTFLGCDVVRIIR